MTELCIASPPPRVQVCKAEITGLDDLQEVTALACEWETPDV